MKKNNRKNARAMISVALISFVILLGFVVSHAEDSNTSKVIFHVGWYDVGKAALEGLKGVKRVDKGFKGFKEINTVYYDPALISIGDMENALKNAGTYRGQVNEME